MKKQHIILQCDNCGADISVKLWQIKGKHKRFHHFCNVKCNNEWKKTTKPFLGKKHTQATKDKMSADRTGVPNYKLRGRTISKELRKKLSLAHKKYFREHPEECEKIRVWATGRKQSLETIKKRWNKCIGQKRTKEQRKRMSKFHPKGKDCHCWRGGVSSVSYRLRRCAKFAEWRKFVFERDNFTCQECGVKGGILHPHHLVSFSIILQKIRKSYGIKHFYRKTLSSRMLWDINNGQTLCKKCHKKTSNYGKNVRQP